LVVHHIKAKSKGGNDDEDNAATLCKACHEAVHVIRRRQDIEISKKGWKRFEEIANKCNARSGYEPKRMRGY
jgi:5-methylcytosine-specific restriction endonuclease McrA